MLTALIAPRAVADPDRLLDRLARERRPGFVFDYANVIAPQQHRAIEGLLLELEQETGAQVKVVTLASLEGGEIDDISNRLFERWGIGGDRGQDDGVLILAAMQERRVRIEVGYGLEGAIPDARAGRMLDEYVLPRMRAGNPGDAMLAGAIVVAEAVAREAGVVLSGRSARTPPRQGERGVHPLIALLVMIGIIYMAIRHPFLFLLFLSSGRGGRAFGGGGFGGGGFGGFGGGLSGGGGASRGW